MKNRSLYGRSAGIKEDNDSLRHRLVLILVTLSACTVALLVLTAAAHSLRIAVRQIDPAKTESLSFGTIPSSDAVVVQASPANSPDLVHRGMLASQLYSSFAALGRRLERPGSERLTMTGSLKIGGDAQATQFTLIWELPGRLRLVEQRGLAIRTLVFDGQDLASSDGRLDSTDRDTVELLVFGSAEHFFISQARGASATRFLGTRFHLEDKSLSPAHDLIEVTEQIGFKADTRSQTRIYHFNSDTHLLERVSYLDGSTPSQTVVKLGDWMTINGERIAHRIELLQDETPAITLVINAVAIGPRMTDGAFTLPR